VFVQRPREGVQRAEAPVLALQLSLNAPVVTLAGLPVGPARAAIALAGWAAGGGARVWVAVRALRGGEIALFEGAEPEPARDPERALEAALAFAEGMGFLFDEVIPGRGRDGPVAERLWREHLGLEVGPEGVEPEPRPEADRGPESAAAMPRGAGPWLSKFRRRPASSVPGDAETGLLLRWVASL